VQDELKIQLSWRICYLFSKPDAGYESVNKVGTSVKKKVKDLMQV
jgi:hypothetical protein